MQLSWAKPGNPMEGGQKAGTNRREGREGGEEREGERGSRAKPGNQLVCYIVTRQSEMTDPRSL